MKIDAIIQARMGSTRLPGKVLMDIEGKPMLWHVVERTKQAKNIDEVILAIPDTKENDILENFALKNNIKYYRGSEKNVLSRYYETAQKFKSDLIVRITSDGPLIDPAIVDLIIETYLKLKVDFCSNALKRTFPIGLDAEIFSFKVLEKAYKEAQNTVEKEHPDEYIIRHPELFTRFNVENKKNLSSIRCTVDEIKDLEFVRETYKRLYPKKKMFYMEDVLSLLKKHSELIEINKGVKQKII
jgi:spore coat polysaccharide biosynthesis protein SpsF (cytidylyltransferase family)